MTRIHVDNNSVSGVAIGTDATATTSVVVDLGRVCKYELVSGPGDKLTLKLQLSPTAAKNTSVPAKPATPVTTATLLPPAELKPEPSKTAATFVVVDPAYAPKKDGASIEPPVRAVDAASKFVERP